MNATAPSKERGAYALLTDGTCVQIRAATPGDWQAVHDFAAALGRESVYRRYFGFPKYPGKTMADAVCDPAPQPTAPARGALLAILGDRVVGLAEWIRARDPHEAEIAFAVADVLQGHGVATLLAEHLLDAAHRVGVRRFVAVTQSDNYAMLDVFAALGIPARRAWDEGTWSLSIDLEVNPAERIAKADVEARRERAAGTASLLRILKPGCVVVIGEPHDPATRAVRSNLSAFTGRVEAAGPDGSDLPPGLAIDLAVITSPPALAVAAARVCAKREALALIVTATGFDAAAGRALLEICRGAGMRLLGPGSLGIANPGGGRRLNATLAQGPLAPGHTGVAVQSGGVGLALLSHLTRLGIGVSTFAGVGEKYDISANDLLMHWESDSDTHLGLVHVASFGNPRKFARTARRLARRIPLLAVDPQQSPSAARSALYAQAGITAVPSLGALVAAAALLAHQPPPLGRRVALIANTSGMVSLAVQACVNSGLEVTAAVNVTPAADARQLYLAMKSATAMDSCDALLVALAPTARHGPIGGLRHDAVPHHVPLLAVLVEQPETVAAQSDADASGRRVPCYNDAAVAAAALAAAVTAAGRRTVGDAPPDEPPGIDRHAAASVIETCLASAPRGRSLDPSERTALLAAFGIASFEGSQPPTAPARLPLAITAWQDVVFGPLLTCAPGGDSAPGAVSLAPASARDLTDMAVRALGAPGGQVAQLASLLARIAALVDSCPQVASARCAAWHGDDGAIRIKATEVTIAPAERADPYLRRLRRAPVE